MALLRSFEALLYELVSWLAFYPVTLWRCIRHPLRMMAYAESELTDKTEDQYGDALSPPIFLFVTLIIAHVIELRFSATSVILPGILADDRNLLLIRAVMFSLFPLLLAVESVRNKQQRLTRTTLRPAFYSQCYLAAPFVLVLNLAIIIGHRTDATAQAVGLLMIAAAIAWYVGALTAWYATTKGMGHAHAFARAIAAFVVGALAVLLAAVALGYALGLGT